MKKIKWREFADCGVWEAKAGRFLLQVWSAQGGRWYASARPAFGGLHRSTSSKGKINPNRLPPRRSPEKAMADAERMLVEYLQDMEAALAETMRTLGVEPELEMVT